MNLINIIPDCSILVQVFKLLIDGLEIFGQGVAKMFGVNTLQGGVGGEAWITLLVIGVIIGVVWIVAQISQG